MGTMVKPARAVPDIALLPLRELVLSLLLLNTLIATLLTLILPLSTFWVNMVYSHLIGACICTLTEVGRRLLWTRCGWPSPWRFGLLLLGCTVLGASLGATLAGWVTHFSLHEGPIGDLLSNVLAVLGISMLASLTLSAWLWQRGRLAEARLDAETALRGQTLAELRALQAQVEPHFLFNTLAHLDALLQNDTLDEAQDLLDYFTRYLRGTLSTSRQEASPLADELARIEPWLRILSIRFGQRLRWRIDASEQAAHCLLPPMLLQPLAENAIRHGIEPAVGGGVLHIDAQVHDGALCICVRDDGVGLEAAHTRPGAGSGLANIRARLAALYGDAASLTLTPLAPHGVEARLSLPAQRPGSRT